MRTTGQDISKLDALLDSAVDAIITIDVDGLIETVNQAAERLFGYAGEALLGHNVKMLMPDPWSREHDGYLAHHRKTGEKRIIGIGREVQGKRKDGSIFPMHLSVSEYAVDGQTFYTGIIHDLTDRKRAEDALFRAQKMDAIGQLTGGMAHDFNNLLTIITGNLELLDMQLTDDGQRDLLREAQEAADLGAELTARLLAFARRSVLEPEKVDLNALTAKMMGLLSRTLGGSIEIKTSLADDLWIAQVDPGQLENVLLNLAVNARDAMPRGGTLIVETSNEEMDAQFAALQEGLEPGDYVRISISDSGTGMSSETRQQAFEPFFTTKGPGKGTGLGLSMVYGFAKQSGGYVTIYSEMDLGTTINLYLPRQMSAASRIDDAAARNAGALSRGQGQLILVVEDDPRVRRLSAQRLEILGYRTVTASDGHEALAILEQNEDITLVFTDLVMPGGLSGYELAEQVRQRTPHKKILLTSGYAEDLVHGSKLGEFRIRLLRKPYKQADLAETIRQVLASKH